MPLNADLTYLEAAVLVLQEADRPFSAREIFYSVTERRLVKYTKLVQFDNVRRLIDRDIQNNPRSVFKRMQPGCYTVKPEFVKEYIHNVEKKGRILVFDITKNEGMFRFHGIRKAIEPYSTLLLNDPDPLFVERLIAEDSRDLKQIVSYILVMSHGKLLRFRRQPRNINRVGEFVDGHFAIGYGGHVQETDRSLFSSMTTGYMESVQRELFEEIKISISPNDPRIKILGVLNDDSSPLGEKHFAFVHLLELNETEFDGGEEAIQNPHLVSFEEISRDFQLYEYWSKLCLLNFFSEHLSFTCHIQPNTHFSLKEHGQNILIVGEIGSGKSKACHLFEKEYGYTLVPCSKVMKDLLDVDAHCELTRRELQDMGHQFVSSQEGHRKFAEGLFRYIQEHPGSRYVLDGLRYPETLSEFRKLVNDKVAVIYIDTMVDIRYKNYIMREGNHSLTFQEFLNIVDHPVESRINAFLPEAQIVVFNQETLVSFEYTLMEYLDSELGPVDSFLVNSWDINASRRHDQLVSGKDISFTRLLVPSILDILKKTEGFQDFKVLDVGCGTGVLSELLSHHVARVVGVDPSGESIKIARDHCRKQLNVDFFCLPIEEFPEEHLIYFDFAIAHMVLHTIPPDKLPTALSRIHKLMTPSGTFVASLPHPVFYPLHKPETFEIGRTKYNYNIPRFYRHTFTISNDRDPLPSKTPYFHRPLMFYTKVFADAGFLVKLMHEPNPSEEIKSFYPKEKRFDDTYFMIFECVK